MTKGFFALIAFGSILLIHSSSSLPTQHPPESWSNGGRQGGIGGPEEEQEHKNKVGEVCNKCHDEASSQVPSKMIIMVSILVVVFVALIIGLVLVLVCCLCRKNRRCLCNESNEAFLQCIEMYCSFHGCRACLNVPCFERLSLFSTNREIRSLPLKGIDDI